jgi:rhomboid protease GluP
VFQRKTTGSVVCPSCGSLVGVRDDKCYTCGRANPGLWGFAPLLRRLGTDLGVVPLVIGVCSVLYVLTLLVSGSELRIVGGGMSFLAPSGRALLMFGMSGAYPVYFEGAWWTLLSASWLHGNLLHIIFNMYWVRRLGPDVVELFGPARTVIVRRVRRRRFSELDSVYIGIPIPAARRVVYDGRVGVDPGAARCVGALWTQRRQPPDSW